MRRALYILASLLALGVIFAAWLAHSLWTPYRGFSRDGVFVEIPRGASTRVISRLLEERGVVRSRWAFELLGRAWLKRRLQAGEYFFERSASSFAVLEALAEGRVYTRSVSIPEGLAMTEIADLLEKEKLCHREDFLAAARDPAPIRDLAPRARNLEGFLFPATYEFPRRVTAHEIVAAMVRRFRTVWEGLPADGRVAGYTPAEIITLASLVEEETGASGERPVIAGVFYNRLRKKVALQCDPTVIYALRLNGRFDGALHTRQLRFNSPYNTYRYLGLPPGPITNPGQAALRAALFPPRVEYFYFVADTKGGHFFSRTLAEHNANVTRYRRLLAEASREILLR